MREERERQERERKAQQEREEEARRVEAEQARLREERRQELLVLVSQLNDTFRSGQPVSIPYDLLALWTNGFSEECIIGRGGFGTVHEGLIFFPPASLEGMDIDNKNAVCVGKKVAVKKVNADVLTDPANPDAARDVQRAVKREINVLGSFRNNPHLIRLVGYYVPAPQEDMKQVCLVYEYAEKGDLFKFLSTEQVEWQVRLRVSVGIAKGLNYLHANGALHRDIKGSNIVIQDSHTPKIIDCGLSKYVPDVPVDGAVVSVFTTTGMKFGTPEYMCPEYLRSRSMHYDAMCDIYSFGIVVLELLTGLKQASNDVYLQDEVHELPVDGDWPEECVAELRELCEQCVERRSKRIKNMTTVMRRLIEISKKYDMPTTMERTLMQEVEVLRQQVEELRVEKDVRARIVESEETRVCSVCFDTFKISQGVVCVGRDQHFLCFECLSDMVKSQSTHVQDFNNNGCSIVCGLCESYPIDERTTAPFEDGLICRVVDEVAVNAFIKVQRDATAALRDRVAEGRLERERQRLHNQHLEETARLVTNEAEKRRRNVERHVLRIREDILNTHCPHCDLVFSEWTGCMAVQHHCEDQRGVEYGCMKFFCGWCLMRCTSNNQCHEHVKSCRMNKNPGSYYGSWDQYLQVQAAVRRDKIRAYLDENIAEGERGVKADVIEALRASDLEPLGIHL